LLVLEYFMIGLCQANNKNMRNVYASPGSIEDLSFDGFAALDQAYNGFGAVPDDLARYGRYEIANPVIIDPPADVTDKGYVLTNPSQIETVTQIVGDQEELVTRDFAYFRYEPASLHLGHTSSLPYLILEDGQGKSYLKKFDNAMPLLGEDPRITRGVKIRGLLGKIHEGWLISTVVATPKPDEPACVESIKQVFYWGESLNKLEPVAELNDTKNTCLYPVPGDYDDTSLDVFPRPKPHIGYLRLPDITALTNEAIDSAGINITEGFLPEGVHCGPNFVKDGGPNYRELDVHEAILETLPDGKLPHYRLRRYGYELPRDGLPEGRLLPLGVIATRAQFPDAKAKSPEPENGIADYWDIVYGSVGRISHAAGRGSRRVGRMIVGVSDSQVGLADVIRVS
jgi:hypothetical protein